MFWLDAIHQRAEEGAPGTSGFFSPAPCSAFSPGFGFPCTQSRDLACVAGGVGPASLGRHSPAVRRGLEGQERWSRGLEREQGVEVNSALKA